MSGSRSRNSTIDVLAANDYHWGVASGVRRRSTRRTVKNPEDRSAKGKASTSRNRPTSGGRTTARVSRRRSTVSKRASSTMDPGSARTRRSSSVAKAARLRRHQASQAAASWTELSRGRVQDHLRDLHAVFTNNRVADLIGVSQSQPSRWSREEESPNFANSRRILDLNYVISRFILAWPQELLDDWLVGSNAFLGNARPIDVLDMEGPQPLIEAIDASEQGAFA